MIKIQIYYGHAVVGTSKKWRAYDQPMACLRALPRTIYLRTKKARTMPVRTPPIYF